MDTALRYFLLVYLFVYFVAVFLWRSYLVWKRTDFNPVPLGDTNIPIDFIGMVFRVIAVVSVIIVLVYFVSSDWYQYLTPIVWLQKLVFTVIGLVLLVLSLFWIFTAQIQMGNSWQLGIDVRSQTELIQHGLFKLSRNPIFLGMRVNLLGFFLVLPNAVTLVILIVGDVLMQIQVRLEEEHLAQTHEERYQEYCRQTRRWI